MRMLSLVFATCYSNLPYCQVLERIGKLEEITGGTVEGEGKGGGGEGTGRINKLLNSSTK